MLVRTNQILAPIAAKSLHDFLRPFNKILSKPKQKHLMSALKGMISGETVVLSQVGREVASAIMPKTYCEKLGKSLENFSVLGEVQGGKASALELEMIILDGGDIQRPHARKLEEINPMRDGSTGNNYGQGYGLHGAIARTKDGEYLPLLLERYSEQKLAEKNVVEKILELLSPHHGAFWCLDRGFDDKKFLYLLLDEDQDFLVRLDRNGGQRSLMVGDEKHLVSTLLDHFKGEKIGYRRVKLPGRDEKLTLIHYRHHKHREPLALLTTLTPKTRKQAINIAKKYLKRWKIEDYFRFIKQRFGLEKVMLQNPRRVDGLLALILLASAFIMKMEQRQTDPILNWFYIRWLKKNGVGSSWSAFARFMQEVLPCWKLTFRTAHAPPNHLQLAISCP